MSITIGRDDSVDIELDGPVIGFGKDTDIDTLTSVLKGWAVTVWLHDGTSVVGIVSGHDWDGTGDTYTEYVTVQPWVEDLNRYADATVPIALDTIQAFVVL